MQLECAEENTGSLIFCFVLHEISFDPALTNLLLRLSFFLSLFPLSHTHTEVEGERERACNIHNQAGRKSLSRSPPHTASPTPAPREVRGTLGHKNPAVHLYLILQRPSPTRHAWVHVLPSEGKLRVTWKVGGGLGLDWGSSCLEEERGTGREVTLKTTIWG